MPAQYPSFGEIRDVQRKLTEMKKQYYFHHDLFSIQWWLLVALMIVSWMVWWKIVDKSRVREILLYGAVLSVVIIMLDDIGSELGLWSYPYQAIPLIPRLNAIDLSVLPVFHMIVYQYYKSWKSFLAANAVMALSFAFIAEPLFVWLDIYHMENWRYIYSIPLYIAKALFVRWLLEFIQAKASVKQQRLIK
ncbi:CBO0543 family protein [Paenibacillus cymbidii]|uniref:CBO0543 family protein n=1 Tax=Paenibacillus cymbidii TaxID=1639034 RepID=UPI0010803185|nr:CBO0543 family protein [Paenibacillus cymbidii]